MAETHQRRAAWIRVWRLAHATTTQRLLLRALVGQKEQPDHGSRPLARACSFVNGEACLVGLSVLGVDRLVYIGYSAGAILAAPTLEPLSVTSPFTTPPELELTGLGLVDVLILPHDDHPGRNDKHRCA